MTELYREMYRGYEIKESEWGWFNIRRQGFGVATFHTLAEAKRAVDDLVDGQHGRY